MLFPRLSAYPLLGALSLYSMYERSGLFPSVSEKIKKVFLACGRFKYDVEYIIKRWTPLFWWWDYTILFVMGLYRNETRFMVFGGMPTGHRWCLRREEMQLDIEVSPHAIATRFLFKKPFYEILSQLSLIYELFSSMNFGPMVFGPVTDRQTYRKCDAYEPPA